MAEKLEWVFEGVDKFSGPVSGMTGGLGHFSFELNQVTELLGKMAEGLEWVGEKALNFFEFGIDAVSFKESTLVAFETILGTKEQAMNLFNKAQVMADFSPFKTKDVVTSFQKLLGAGFTKEEVPIVFQAVGDMASFQTTGAEMNQVMDSVTNDMAIMMASGVADWHHFRLMLQATKGIVNMNQVGEALAKNLGVTPAEAMAQLKGGTLSAKQGVVALLDAMKQVQHGEVGTSILRQAGTIKGLKSTFASLGENFFFAMGDESGQTSSIKGINDYKEALGNVITYFNVQFASGKRVAKALEQVFGGALHAIFGGFAGKDGVKGISAIVDPVISWMEGIDWDRLFGDIGIAAKAVGTIVSNVFGGLTGTVQDSNSTMAQDIDKFLRGLDFKTIAEDARSFGNALGTIASALMQITKLIEPLADSFGQNMRALHIVDDFTTRGMGSAEAMIEGFTKGIQGGSGIVASSMIGLAAGANQTLATEQDIHSPSGVYEDFGGYMAQGLALGIDGGASEVDAAISRLGVAPSTSGAAPAGKSVSVSFGSGAIQIDARGADGVEIARKLREILPSQLAMAFEGMAMEAGS